MSVVMFDKTEWDRLVGWIKCMWSGDNPVKSAVRYSDAFRDARELDRRTGGTEKPTDDETLCAEVFDRAIHYWQIANRIAWSVNYTGHQVNPVPEPDEHSVDLENSAVLLSDWRKIHSELRSIRYNLATNGGNTFLPAPWSKLLDSMIGSIAEYIVSRSAPNRGEE